MTSAVAASPRPLSPAAAEAVLQAAPIVTAEVVADVLVGVAAWHRDEAARARGAGDRFTARDHERSAAALLLDARTERSRGAAPAPVHHAVAA